MFDFFTIVPRDMPAKVFEPIVWTHTIAWTNGVDPATVDPDDLPEPTGPQDPSGGPKDDPAPDPVP